MLAMHNGGAEWLVGPSGIKRQVWREEASWAERQNRLSRVSLVKKMEGLYLGCSCHIETFPSVSDSQCTTAETRWEKF